MKTAFLSSVDFRVGLVLFWAVASWADQFSSVPREDFWQPGPGVVNTVAQGNGVIYVGGSFQTVLERPASGVGAYDLDSSARDPDFPFVNGRAMVVVPDQEGGWFIGGEFTAVGNVRVQNLAHIRADKTVDTSWKPNADAGVETLALSGNLLYAGGSYTTLGSQPRNGLAAIDRATGLPSSWDPNPTPAEFPQATFSHISTIAISGQTVYVGGVFSSIGGQVRGHLAALDATTGRATNWNPNPQGVKNGGFGGFMGIGEIVVAANSIYVLGQFTNIANEARNTIAAFDEGSGQLRPWDPNPVIDDITYAGPAWTAGQTTTAATAKVSALAA